MVKKVKPIRPEAVALETKNKPPFKKLKKSMKAKKLETEEKYRRGIVYISHLPYGFFENELKGFFKQFGQVRRIRLARSPKTGGSKGYGFVEFEFLEVAKIAAESMNNYLMYDRLVKCKVLEPNVNAKKLFAGRIIRKQSFPTLFRRNKLIKLQSEPMEAEEVAKKLDTNTKIIDRNTNKLASLGISYKYEYAPEEPIEVISTPTRSPKQKRKKSFGKAGFRKTLEVKHEHNLPLGTGISKRTSQSPAQKRRSKKSIDKAQEDTPPPIKHEGEVEVVSSNTKQISTPVAEIPKAITSPSTPKGKKSLDKIKEVTPLVIKSEKKKKKTPEKSKFSPKLLRSKTRQSEALTPVPPVAVKQTPKKIRKSIAVSPIGVKQSPKQIRKFSSPKEIQSFKPGSPIGVKQSPKQIRKFSSPKEIENSMPGSPIGVKQSPKQIRKFSSPKEIQNSMPGSPIGVKESPKQIRKFSSPKEIQNSMTESPIGVKQSPKQIRKFSSPKEIQNSMPGSPVGVKQSPKQIRKFSSPKEIQNSMPGSPVGVKQSPKQVRKSSLTTLTVMKPSLKSSSVSPVAMKQSPQQILKSVLETPGVMKKTPNQSRKSIKKIEEIHKVEEVPPLKKVEKSKNKTPEKSKFSPKMLRSRTRQSDISNFTTIPKKTPAKKPNIRKSMK